ncbi:MAG TPA: hypothetical protein VIP09_09240 [Dehalococcoidia bacterium]|jgi:hypothetical protein
MTSNLSQMDQLRQAVLDGTWERDLGIREVWPFMEEVLAGHVVESFYISLAPVGYVELKPKAQIVVAASGLLYDFIFGDDLQRYDVVVLHAISRVEERREVEPSIEGPPRQKVHLEFEWSGGLGGSSLTLIAFGPEGRRLSEFAKFMKRKAFQGA